ncbi:hypothetical protein MPSEU_000926400 [Mayamaea pseudoterrestris]|nr:hypothetical protein MPSEU_000926400 [Mayamaea pseudoterrestris]
MSHAHLLNTNRHDTSTLRRSAIIGTSMLCKFSHLQRKRICISLLVSLVVIRESVGFSITERLDVRRQCTLHQTNRQRRYISRHALGVAPLRMETIGNENDEASLLKLRNEYGSVTRNERRNVTGVTLKMAVDANGNAGETNDDSTATTPRNVRFTSAASLNMVHRLRRNSDAVLVGRGTVAADDPSLTVRRNVTCDKQPLRVILDPHLRLMRNESSQQQYTIFNDGLPTAVYHCVSNEPQSASSDAINAFDQINKTLNLTQVLADLASEFAVRHVMVEGGPVTAQAFLDERLVDRALIVRAPRVCFRNPATAISAGMEAKRLREAGLELLGVVDSEGDKIECWSRPGLPWPTEKLGDWP